MRCEKFVRQYYMPGFKRFVNETSDKRYSFYGWPVRFKKNMIKKLI